MNCPSRMFWRLLAPFSRVENPFNIGAVGIVCAPFTAGLECLAVGLNKSDAGRERAGSGSKHVVVCKGVVSVRRVGAAG